jgi:predicted hydrocarbon binding protein
MTQYIRSTLVKEMLESGAFDLYRGEFLFWDIPGIPLPVNSWIIMNTMKDRYPEITMNELNYQLGKMQSHRGNKVLVQRFGYKINEKLMKDSFGKSETLGMGTFEFIGFDLENKIFTVINPNNPYPYHYMKLFGRQKEAVCHFLRGLCAGSFQAFFEDEEMFCVETDCVAKGDKACVFRVKPLSQWDMDDLVVKKQLITHKFDKKVFEEYYSWDNLISRHAGKPRDEKQLKEDNARILKIVKEYKRQKLDVK